MIEDCLAGVVDMSALSLTRLNFCTPGILGLMCWPHQTFVLEALISHSA